MAHARLLVDFAAAAGEWHAIDDRVMGGVSRSRLEPRTGGAAFVGHVSLEQGGGFASVRGPVGDFAVPGARAYVLHARGDGRRYKLTIRTDASFDGAQYQAGFDTDGEWRRIELPLADFVASARGRRLPDHPPLDPARVRGFGFMISERQAGPFVLELRRLEVD